MKLTGNLKKQVEAAATMEEKKGAIESAGMLLDDEELAAVAGGSGNDWTDRTMTPEEYLASQSMHFCPECHSQMSNDNTGVLPNAAYCDKCGIHWVL